MLRSLTKAIGVGALALLSAVALSAQATVIGTTVHINGVPVFKFNSPCWGISAETIAKRVRNNLEDATGRIAVRQAEKNYLIMMGSKAVVTVTPVEASSRNVHPRKLAYVWAADLKQALTSSPLKVGKAEINVGRGDTADIPVTGKLASNAKVTSSDPEFMGIERTAWGFRAKALRPGTGFITVSSNGVVRQINFSIKPYAVQFPDQVVAYVNGRPAIPGTVKGAIESAIKLNAEFAPLADIDISYTTTMPSVGTGMTVSIPTKIRVSAPGTIERNGTLTVKVVNLGLPKDKDDTLWYCNDPERITKEQNLFAAFLNENSSARMLYHHINDTTQPVIVRTLILNESELPAKVLLIPGDSAPDRDPVGAGMRAGDMFFRASSLGSGEVITIPGKSSIPLSFRRLKPQEVISGLCSIRLIEGPEKLLVRADSFPPVEVEPRWRPALTSSTPWREVGAQQIRDWDRGEYRISDHLYPNPFRTEEVNYKVGGRHSVIRLGQKAIAREDEAGRLDGNFGVTYDIEANLSNPEDIPVDVEIVFETSAGYSGGIFYVDDNYIVTPKLLPKKEARLAKYRLTPGASRKVKIRTMPLSGSSYPATIFIRAVSPDSSRDIVDVSAKRK
jgi:hypothetical protein